MPCFVDGNRRWWYVRRNHNTHSKQWERPSSSFNQQHLSCVVDVRCLWHVFFFFSSILRVSFQLLMLIFFCFFSAFVAICYYDGKEINFILKRSSRWISYIFVFAFFTSQSWECICVLRFLQHNWNILCTQC